MDGEGGIRKAQLQGKAREQREKRMEVAGQYMEEMWERVLGVWEPGPTWCHCWSSSTVVVVN